MHLVVAIFLKPCEPDFQDLCTIRPLCQPQTGKGTAITRQYRDAHGNSFRFDGNELVCDKYRIGGFMPFSSSGYAQMRIPATDDMQVKITDSNQVTDQTVLM